MIICSLTPSKRLGNNEKLNTEVHMHYQKHSLFNSKALFRMEYYSLLITQYYTVLLYCTLLTALVFLNTANIFISVSVFRSLMGVLLIISHVRRWTSHLHTDILKVQYTVNKYKKLSKLKRLRQPASAVFSTCCFNFIQQKVEKTQKSITKIC